MTQRRTFIRMAAGSLLALPLASLAQSTPKIARIGWLTPGVFEVHSRAFREAMRTYGDVEGQAYIIETRSADENLDRLPRLAAELVASRVDIIVAVGPPAILAARQATGTIPIVMAFWGRSGLIETGMVANLARPGGNVTGVYMLGAELDAKRLDLLLQAVPKARKVGCLDPGYALSEVQKTAQDAGVQLRMTEVGLGDDSYVRAFEAMAQAHVDALLVTSSPRYFGDARKIIDLAASRRIPAIYEWTSMAEDGGLMAYGPTFSELDGRVAAYVQRILKGAKPGDLPIEQPSKFELVFNLGTAKTLGMTIPPSLLLRADRVIQ